jgi:hypothetical protein
LRIADFGIGNRKLTILLVVYPVLLKTSPWNSAGLIPVACSRINLRGAGKWGISILEYVIEQERNDRDVLEN